MITSLPTPHHYQINTTVAADDNSMTTTTTTSATTPWSSQTNWTVSCGSLDSAVTFESFDFPIDSEFTARKPPLLLLPPSSSDFEPCEIKLNFTQEHEIRQVYVRSTARVYEIYYAPDLQSENEYLCTVRCSAAFVEDNLFPATDVKEATSVNLVGQNGILPNGRVAGENKIGSNEDDWVEVKLPVGRVDDGNTYLPNQTSNNIRNYQDYYEATAEINDSVPCMSLTLRLLSLQSKDCVYVDEVYVFADPIDMNDPENQTVNAESSAGSSLMTMLVPTLLGLSKSRSVQLHDQHSSKSVGRPIETESGPATSTNPVNLADQQDEKLLELSEDKAELNRFQVPASAPDKDKSCDMTTRNAFSYNRAEFLLEQLVSRVTRIEDICMRFEETMLKPINSIEARLQHVEQQVELLAKNSQRPVSPSCLRFELNPRSINNDGRSNFLLCGEHESEKEGSVSTLTNKPPEDTSVAVSSQGHKGLMDTSVAVSTQAHEGLMATAPESPHCDEKQEVNDVLESPKTEKPKKSVSIDDALAAALAGFSSFTKANDNLAVVPLQSPEEKCLKCNEAPVDTSLGPHSNDEASAFCESLKATAPEFTGEEDDDATKSSEALKATAPEFSWEENDDDATKASESLEVTAPAFTGEEDVSVISPTLKSSMVDVEDCTGDTTTTSCDASTEIPDNSFCLLGTSEAADEEATSPTANFSSLLPHENYKNDAQLVKLLNFDQLFKSLNFDKADILKYFPDQSPDAACTTQVAYRPSAGEVKDGSESTVDFESSILEVKFAPSENGSLKSRLESLLSDTDDPATDEGALITPQLNVCTVEEKTSTANNLLVELDGDHVGEAVQQDLLPVQQETSFASLI